MDFIHMLIVLVVAAALIYGAQIVFIKVLVGDADNAINGNGQFNPRTSLNKTLNKKMIYYGRINSLSMRWLIFCSNVLLPAFTVLALWNSISQSLAPDFIPDTSFFLYLGVAGACLITTMLIRSIDTTAFFISFLPSIAFLVYLIFPLSAFSWVSIIALCVFVPTIALNAWYFIRRRELFMLTLRQMKQKVEIIDAQNESNAS